jgi:uncharacterized membrane protein YkvI
MPGSPQGRAWPARVAEYLRYAAAPTFAILALLTGLLSSDPAHTLCAGMQGGSIVGGMSLMYLLMAGFHSPPWLRLIARGTDYLR